MKVNQKSQQCSTHHIDSAQHGGLRTKGVIKKQTKEHPLVSIITAVFNGESHLQETLETIRNQEYPNLEIIVIDGGSTDGTLDIIKQYEHVIDYWISEPDQGISDAFNKGLKFSNGDYINFQGDGDGFSNPSSVSNLMKNIDPTKDWLICGQIERIDSAGKRLFTSKAFKKFRKHSLLFRMSLPHQGLFTHKKFFERYGIFDTDNKYCMDYEILLRAYTTFPNVVLKNLVVARWRNDGLGNNKDLEIFNEYNKIKIKNKVAKPIILSMVHRWTLLKFYIKKVYSEKFS